MSFEILLVTLMALGLAVWMTVDERIHTSRPAPTLHHAAASGRRRRALERARGRHAA